MADESNSATVPTPAQFFEELLPAGFAAQQAESPSTEEVALQYHVTGEGGGDWAVKIAGGKMTVERGTTPALLTFTLSSKDLIEAVTGTNGASPNLILPANRRGGKGPGAVKGLKGTMALNLTRPAGEPFKMEMSFNGAATPRTVMTIALEDHLAIQEGTLNGQQAFMTGKMRVEGDLGFLMQVGMATAS